MKKILSTILCFFIIFNGEAFCNKPPRGFNYKRHYRKTHRVQTMNHVFNFNNCKGKTFKV